MLNCYPASYRHDDNALVKAWMTALFVLLASGCAGTDTPHPIDRDNVLTTFERAGEPLKIRYDVRAASDSVDAGFVPRAAGPSEQPFVVVLYDDERAASETSQWVQSMGGPPSIRWKNVAVGSFQPGVQRERRARLIAALRSL